MRRIAYHGARPQRLSCYAMLCYAMKALLAAILGARLEHIAALRARRMVNGGPVALRMSRA